MNKLDLKKFSQLQSDLQKPNEKIEVIISLGTCGIAAGGDEIYEYFKSEITKRNLSNVVLKKTGCLGLCSQEPNVEIKYPGTSPVLYGDVDISIATQIFDRHICNGKLIDKYIISMPAPDLIEGDNK